MVSELFKRLVGSSDEVPVQARKAVPLPVTDHVKPKAEREEWLPGLSAFDDEPKWEDDLMLFVHLVQRNKQKRTR